MCIDNNNEHLPQNLAAFLDFHAGETILVCGCGSSLNELSNPERFITIGVNDVGRKFDPTYLVVLNPRQQFKNDRFQFVDQSNAKAVFTQLDLGIQHPHIIRFKLGQRGGTDLSNPNTLPYTRNSPYVALCLAMHMGAKKIGLIGIDFTDHHFFAATGRHSLSHSITRIDVEYTALAQVARDRGVEIINLSEQSRLTGFAKIRQETFIEMESKGKKTNVIVEQAPLKIVSYSTTPVAGVPVILARCIDAQTQHSCECVWQQAYYGNGVAFVGGVEWSKEAKKAEQLLIEADLVIVHNGYVAAQHRRIMESKPVITMAHNYGWNVDTCFVNKGMPGVVVGQYQVTLPEFVGWQIVPNPVPLWEPEYQPGIKPDRLTIAYTPSGKHGRYPRTHRLFWHSKGYDVTMRVLDQLAAKFPIQLEVIRTHQVSHAESLAMKRRAHVVIDECVTGSYHRNSLEGLAMGCVVINGMELFPEVGEAFGYCAGIDEYYSPFLHADLESLQGRLLGLVESDLGEVARAGQQNHKWMKQFWDFASQWERCWLPVVKKALAGGVALSPKKAGKDIFRITLESRATVVGRLSVVIPHGGEERLDLLKHTLTHLRKLPEVGEIIVVEMGGHPSAKPIMKKEEIYEFIEDHGSFHKARAMNAGLRLAHKSLVLWLDNDLIIPQDFLGKAMIEKEQRKLSCLITYSNTYFFAEKDSQQLMQGQLEIQSATPVSCNSSSNGCRGGAVLIDREWALSCGGMREEFIGWGGEDDAWFYFARHFGAVGVTEQTDQNLYHLYHQNSGGYGEGEQIANNPHYEQNLLILRKLMRLRKQGAVLNEFPIVKS